MTVAPEPIPVTIPEVTPTVPTKGVLLLQVPPVLKSASGVIDPTHTFIVPVIAAGNGFTVTTTFAIQPVTGNT